MQIVPQAAVMRSAQPCQSQVVSHHADIWAKREFSAPATYSSGKFTTHQRLRVGQERRTRIGESLYSISGTRMKVPVHGSAASRHLSSATHTSNGSDRCRGDHYLKLPPLKLVRARHLNEMDFSSLQHDSDELDMGSLHVDSS